MALRLLKIAKQRVLTIANAGCRRHFVAMALKGVSKGLLNENTLRKLYDVSVKRTVSEMFQWNVKDQETHTGQKFVENDYRLSRFVYKTKQVNPNWAVKLIAEAPPIEVDGRIACCDGGMGATGHPKVYINVDKPGHHSCLYCGLRFYKKESHH